MKRLKMGDIINTNFDKFKDLGFDNSNQWLFYDERFEKFFEFFAENISYGNILTEEEALERKEILEQQGSLEELCTETELRDLVQQFPGLLDSTEEQVHDMAKQYEEQIEWENEYAMLLDELNDTKQNLNKMMGKLEFDLRALEEEEKSLLEECLERAKQLEEMQRENLKLQKERNECFTKRHSPPLFIHQMPLEQYLRKCDSFMQYFHLYMKDNFKMEDYVDFDNQMGDTMKIVAELEKLESSLQFYTFETIIENSQAKALQSVTNLLHIDQIHIHNMADLERETRKVGLMNENHFENVSNILLDEIASCVEQRTQQRIEQILYENTKEKLARAMRRQQNVQRLMKVIFDALSNAELVWILTQLDLEKTHSRCDKSGDLSSKIQQCCRRIAWMQNAEDTVPDNDRTHEFVELISNELAKHIKQTIRSEPKACLYEYEKFNRLLKYNIVNLVNMNYYTAALEKLSEIESLEKALQPFVFDGPIAKPIFDDVRFLKPVFELNQAQKSLECALRTLRQQFQEGIVFRMNNDKLWSYLQLLWIWFLTDTNQLQFAMEEVKRAATKVSSSLSLKHFSGIRKKT